MKDNPTEACGRCSMSTVVDAIDGIEGDSDSEEASGPADAQSARERPSPFDGDRIEVDEAELRRLSPAAWIGRLTTRLDDLARRLTYGR